MTDFLADKRQEIADRLKELKPMVDEHSRLEAAAAALDDIPRPEAPANGRKGPGRPRGSKASTKATAAKAGRKPAAAKPAKGIY